MCKKKNSYALLYIKERSLSKFYSNIKIIDEEYAFVSMNYSIGLIRLGKETIPCEFSYITKPVNGWSFLFKKYPYFPNSNKDGKMYCRIAKVSKVIHSYDIRECLLVEEDIDSNNLEYFLYKGFYKLQHLNKSKEDDLKSVYVESDKHFPKAFYSLLGKPNKGCTENEEELSFEQKTAHGKSKLYWCSGSDLKKEVESRKKTYICDNEHYGLMDALDGNPDAYWNID